MLARLVSEGEVRLERTVRYRAELDVLLKGRAASQRQLPLQCPGIVPPNTHHAREGDRLPIIVGQNADERTEGCSNLQLHERATHIGISKLGLKLRRHGEQVVLKGRAQTHPA